MCSFVTHLLQTSSSSKAGRAQGPGDRVEHSAHRDVIEVPVPAVQMKAISLSVSPLDCYSVYVNMSTGGLGKTQICRDRHNHNL